MRTDRKSPQEVGASWGQTQPEPCTHKRIHSVCMAQRKRKEKVMGITKKGPMHLRKITRLYYEKKYKSGRLLFL